MDVPSNLKKVREAITKLKDVGLTPFVNCARANDLGIDFTDINNVHEAYFAYINARWDMDTISLTWSGVE